MPHKYNTKTSFLQFQASHFGIKNQIMFFSNPFLEPHFSNIFRLFQQTVDFGPPFKIQWALKWDPKSIIFTKLSNENHECFRQWICSRPVFPETMVIIVAFGPSVFLKVILSMEIGLFSVYSVFLCAIFAIQHLYHYF